MDEQARTRIEQTFRANITRVRSLLDVYDLVATRPDHPTTEQTDVLRSGVVLLHASLEDLVRSSSEELLPLQDADVLNEIGFPDGSDRTKAKFTLGELHAFKGSTVDEVIRKAVVTRLQRSNYNNVSELTAALQRIGVDVSTLAPHQGTLESIMKRRHLIVHRADKNPLIEPGQGIPTVQPLGRSTVDTWTAVVSDVGTKVIEALPTA